MASPDKKNKINRLLLQPIVVAEGLVPSVPTIHMLGYDLIQIKDQERQGIDINDATLRFHPMEIFVSFAIDVSRAVIVELAFNIQQEQPYVAFAALVTNWLIGTALTHYIWKRSIWQQS